MRMKVKLVGDDKLSPWTRFLVGCYEWSERRPRWCWRCLKFRRFLWCDEHYYSRFGPLKWRRFFCANKSHCGWDEERGEFGTLLATWPACTECDKEAADGA